MGASAGGTGSRIDAQWVLERLPLVTCFSENDEHYTIRYAAAPGNAAFGYQVEDFVDNRNLIAASAVHSEDLHIMEKAVEQCLVGVTPVVARMRILDSTGQPAPLLLLMHGIFDRTEHMFGLAGMAFDLRYAPGYAGEGGVLSRRGSRTIWTHKAVRPQQITAEWLVDLLPLSTFFAENDAFFTERFNRGPIRRQLGYSSDELLHGRKVMVASLVHPEDADMIDEMFDQTCGVASRGSLNRLRLMHANGRTVPVISFTHGAQVPDSKYKGIVGAMLDVGAVPALQGVFDYTAFDVV